MIENLENKVVIITGAASGIGKGMAQAFADENARLLLADFNEARLQQVQEELSSHTDAISQVLDIRETKEMKQLADKAFNTFGAVHVLCNNAGVACSGLSWEHTDEDWEWIFTTNVRSVTSALRYFVPRMLKQECRSHIINTASLLGLAGSPTTGLYGASKQAVLGLSESLRDELALIGANVDVSVLCPGPVKTNAGEEPGRPAEGRDQPRFPPPLDEVEQFIHQAVEAGMSPREVGDCVVRAVREGHFWIVPDPDVSLAEQRLKDIQSTVMQQT